MPTFPHWHQGVLHLDWQIMVGAVLRRGSWRISLADALSLRELNAQVLQQFSGEGPPAASSGLPDFVLLVALNPEGIGWRLSAVLESERSFQISKVRLVMQPANKSAVGSSSPARHGNSEAQHFVSSGQFPDRIFCNGWQSWSESREYNITKRMQAPRWVARKLFQPYGDGVAVASSGKPGDLHSWSWISWPAGFAGPEAGQQLPARAHSAAASATGQQLPARAHSAAASATQPTHPLQQPNTIGFLGSLNEQDAYTCFAIKAAAGRFEVFRDIPDNWKASIEVAEAPGSPFARTLLDLFWAEGTEDTVYDGWFQALKCTTRPAPALTTGWTSWYRHYNRISAALLEQELRDLAQSQPRPEWFQIDDGWQPRIGDWTSTRASFPQGLKPLADQARSLGFRPGLWLAPFIAEKRSALLREHPEWAERDQQGNLVPAGFNPMWSGTFYALNPDHPDLREHLLHVFETVLNSWGFDGLKLDFLYAAGLQHREGRSRAARMRSAMEFLRHAAGDHFLLGCGVPLAPAFGLVDACRIGADVHLAWEHKLLAWLRNRERVSTRLAVLNAAGRRGLNGRAFVNDPDVYLMRNADPAVKLSQSEQFTLLLVNRLFGRLLFHSDAPAAYPAPTRTLLQRMLAPESVGAVRVLPAPHGAFAKAAEHLAVAFTGEGGPCLALLNFSDTSWTTSLETWCGGFSGTATALWQEEFAPAACRDLLELAPHQCRVFRLPAGTT